MKLIIATGLLLHTLIKTFMTLKPHPKMFTYLIILWFTYHRLSTYVCNHKHAFDILFIAQLHNNNWCSVNTL